MNEQINIVLDKLNDKKINVDEALNEIQQIDYVFKSEANQDKCAKRIKIYIDAVDNDENNKNIKINLPPISLKFVKWLSKFVINIAIKHSDNKKIDPKDIEKIKYIFDGLTMLPPFEIINVDSKDAKVHIYTC